jgi:hypothetical protein
MLATLGEAAANKIPKPKVETICGVFLAAKEKADRTTTPRERNIWFVLSMCYKKFINHNNVETGLVRSEHMERIFSKFVKELTAQELHQVLLQQLEVSVV